jgi:hypothetical protein
MLFHETPHHPAKKTPHRCGWRNSDHRPGGIYCVDGT